MSSLVGKQCCPVSCTVIGRDENAIIRKNLYEPVFHIWFVKTIGRNLVAGKCVWVAVPACLFVSLSHEHMRNMMFQ